MSRGEPGAVTADAAAAPDGGEVVGVPSLGETIEGLAAALGQGRVVAREAVKLGEELLRVALGRSELAPARGDRRFADPTWTAQPALRPDRARLPGHREGGGQRGRRAWPRTVRTRGGAEQARFAADILTSALAPTNFLPTNPAALKRAFETGGRSLLRGLPATSSTTCGTTAACPRRSSASAFKVGRTSRSPRARWSHRDEVAELIQYTPTTERVHQRPLLIVPPPIGRYYFLDLRPGRSFVEYAVSQGLQVFMISWRNPTAEQADWDLDTYAARVSSARSTPSARSPAARRREHCSASAPAASSRTTLLNHLAATGDERVHSVVVRASPCSTSASRPRSAPSPAPRLLAFARAQLAPGGRSSPAGRWARCSPGCAPTTWSSTTWSTTS